jgi:hypothetical protein
MKALHWIVILVLLLLVAYLVGCWSYQGKAPSISASERRECPHAPGDHDVSKTHLTTVGLNTDVPEYHDCQRFIVMGANGHLQYDSLFAIYASLGLDSLDDSLAALEQRFPADTMAVTAAVIVSDHQSYAPLGIRSDFSCLYLFRGALWSAVLVDQEGTNDCTQPISIHHARGTRLEVRRTEVRHLTRDDYPPVARWDWDAVHHEQNIGIKCGAGWCEIGKAGFTASPSYNVNEKAPTEARRVLMVKGWYDEQLLARLPAGGALEPTDVLGTIIPEPGLGEVTNIAQFQTWRVVAHIALSQASPEYKTKFNYDQASPESSHLNTMSLCYGSRISCLGLIPALFYWKAPTCGGGDHWYARVLAVDGTTLYKCIIRYPDDTNNMPSVVVPGTARWRWLAMDETSWKRCVVGCCEVH